MGEFRSTEFSLITLWAVFGFLIKLSWFVKKWASLTSPIFCKSRLTRVWLPLLPGTVEGVEPACRKTAICFCGRLHKRGSSATNWPSVLFLCRGGGGVATCPAHVIAFPPPGVSVVPRNNGSVTLDWLVAQRGRVWLDDWPWWRSKCRARFSVNIHNRWRWR